MDALAGYRGSAARPRPLDSKYEITAANYYKIYKKGIPEGGVVDRFLEEYFGPVPCGGAWC